MANKIDILIKAKDEASKEIDKVKKSLDGMGKDGGESAENLGLDFDSLVGVITAGAAIAAAAAAAFKVALDFSEEGAGIKRLQDTSAMLASSMGFDMDEIVAKVSAASLNTVSDLDIMSSAAKAMMLGVGSSADELASLMEVAAIRGRALGMDATEAFDQIVRGIGRLSPKILDNLGIIVDADVTYAAYAKSIGKAADELTEVEKRQALVNAVIADTAPLLAESGGLTEDSAAAWEQMSAAQKNFWDNLKADAADLMSWWPKFWADFYNNMNASRDIPELREQLNDLMQSLLELEQITPEEYQSVMQMAYAHRAASDSVEVLNGLLEMYGGTASDATISTKGLTDNTQEWADANYEGEASAIAASAAIDKMKEAAEAAAKAQDEMFASLLNVTSINANYKSVIDLAYKYTNMLEEKENLQIERQKLISQGWWDQSKKIKDLDQNIADLDAQMAELADKVVLDMFQATIAIGGVTEAELAAYIQMAIDMGYMSEEGAQAAMEAYGNAIDVINGLAIDEKTGNVTVDAVSAFLTLDLLQQYVLLDKEQRVFVKTYYGTSGGYDPYENYGEAAGGAVHAAASGLAASLPYYWVGERGPEPFFPSVDGRIVSNTQAMSALRGGAGADAREIANAVKQGIKDAMRDSKTGNVYNLTMPTSSNPADVRMAFELMEAWA